MVRKENVHQKQRRQVKDHPESQNPPAHPAQKDSQRKRQLPDENKTDCERQPGLHLWQPEGEAKVGVVQIVERVKDCQGRQVVRAEILEPCDAKLNKR